MVNKLRVVVSEKEQVLSEYFKNFGFVLHKKVVDKQSFNLVYRNENLYIAIYGSSHPYDYPGYFYLAFGDGDDDYPDADWNSATLWMIYKYRGITNAKKHTFYDIYQPNLAQELIAEMNMYLLSFLRDKDTSIISQVRGLL